MKLNHGVYLSHPKDPTLYVRTPVTDNIIDVDFWVFFSVLVQRFNLGGALRLWTTLITQSIVAAVVPNKTGMLVYSQDLNVDVEEQLRGRAAAVIRL
jgi:hypothetical protein